MKKILGSIFLLVFGLCLTACANSGIDYKVSYDNMLHLVKKKLMEDLRFLVMLI